MATPHPSSPNSVGYRRGRPLGEGGRPSGGEEVGPFRGPGSSSGGRARLGKGHHGRSLKFGVVEEHVHGLASARGGGEEGGRREHLGLLEPRGARAKRRARSRTSVGREKKTARVCLS